MDHESIKINNDCKVGKWKFLAIYANQIYDTFRVVFQHQEYPFRYAVVKLFDYKADKSKTSVKMWNHLPTGTSLNIAAECNWSTSFKVLPLACIDQINMAAAVLLDTLMLDRTQADRDKMKEEYQLVCRPNICPDFHHEQSQTMVIKVSGNIKLDDVYIHSWLEHLKEYHSLRVADVELDNVTFYFKVHPCELESLKSRYLSTGFSWRILFSD